MKKFIIIIMLLSIFSLSLSAYNKVVRKYTGGDISTRELGATILLDGDGVYDVY